MIIRLSCLNVPTVSTSRAKLAESMPCSSAVDVGQDCAGQPVSEGAGLSAAQAMCPAERHNAVTSAAVTVALTCMLAPPDLRTGILLVRRSRSYFRPLFPTSGAKAKRPTLRHQP